ncbi:MAG: Uncharacterised protein [Halieaceae bacterium]|nr:MAG: Uncharacterised protein [Halieaceae bacterium]
MRLRPRSAPKKSLPKSGNANLVAVRGSGTKNRHNRDYSPGSGPCCLAVIHSPNQNSAKTIAAVRANRTADDRAIDLVTDSATTARTATTTVSATAAAETTVTIAAKVETASPRVTRRLTHSSSLLRPPQRTARGMKTESSPSALGADAGVAVANATMIGRPMRRRRAQPRAPQTMKPPKRSQSLAGSRIDDGPLTGETRDGADVSARPLSQKPPQPR